MKTIPIINSNKVALVDGGDYDYLSQFRWHLHSSGYAMRGGGSAKVYR